MEQSLVQMILSGKNSLMTLNKLISLNSEILKCVHQDNLAYSSLLTEFSGQNLLVE